MPIRFVAMDTSLVRDLQAGAVDANGQPPERAVALEDGLPCRHCLADIERGEAFLVLAHRPFPAKQPYAEVGPIFVHAEPCKRGGGDDKLPPFLDSPHYIVRGYGANDRIVYGTGQVTPTRDIPAAAKALLADSRVAYVHVRSASNNCYHCRIERA
ncbi:MAG: DUF1203 domain-containing protein [Hyphomicrobiaceae bacterium]|nr:MAG: DUF1203 domain-containing protein [Hyphomicrobiaceae bacterium]